jgi:predicted transcriptional regulator
VIASKGFYDLLFEVSNEIRHGILLLLQEKALRITDITKEMGLNNPETRRHISRLREVGLIQRDGEGFYHLTPFGETALLLLQEFDFLSTNKEYFQTHTLSGIPARFTKGIGELSASMNLANAMDFLRHTENLCKEATDYVWLIVDQFPMYSVSTIVEAIERGIKLKIIEPKDRIFNPDLDSMTSEGAEVAYIREHQAMLTSEETQALTRTRHTPLVDQRMVDEVNVNLFLSDNRCVIAFPTTDGQFDYKGFTATDDSSVKWCRELFEYYWDEAEIRTPTTVKVERGKISEEVGSAGRIVVVGHERPEYDAQAIQDAVDNYDEVILRGRFNLGTSNVYIRRSIVLRGEGRENDIPSTKVYKRGWTFPSYVQTDIFTVDGEDIDVTIENIHFTDFNDTCIYNRQGNSVVIRNNRITLLTGKGRGVTRSDRQDYIIGIISGGTYEHGGFPGGFVIEGNHLDFETAYLQGGFYTRKGLEVEPNYRPDLKNHESYVGTGIYLNWNLGKVIVRDNVVRNMNARGIAVCDNLESADIHIIGNIIESDVFGSYPFSSHIAGIGIVAQSAWARPHSGSHVEIAGNEIKCDKLNYCGIAVYGQSMYQEGAGKLGECVVRDNDIHLGDGSVGVLIRKNDKTEVINNKISGKAYYGFHLWGSEDREGFDLGSNENLVEDNDMTDLVIKAPDEYSDSHIDGRMFTGSEGKSTTAHVWLNTFSKGNVIKIKADETVIDEGEDNITTHIENEETS